MPTIRSLSGLWRSQPDTLGVGTGAIAGDDFDLRMGCQPSGNGFGLAIRQQLDGPVAFEIDDDGAVAAAAAPRPVVNADDPSGWWRRSVGGADQPQQRVAADRHGQTLGQTRARLAAHAEADVALDLGESHGPAHPRRHHAGQAFGKDAARTFRSRTPETADLQMQIDHAALPGQIAKAAQIAAVQTLRDASARGADAARGGRPGEDGNTIRGGRDPINAEASGDQGQK